MKRLVLLALVLTPLLLGAAALFAVHAVDVPMSQPPEGTLVRIPPGLSLRQVAMRLEEAGVLRWRWWLVGLARWQGGARGVRAGTYLFQGAPSPREVLSRLQSPAGSEKRVTVPEGKTAREVFSLLESAGLGGADVFACIASAPEWLLRHDLPATGVEGYLFPDTYAFAGDEAPEAILDTMTERYREKSAALQDERRRAGLSEQEVVTLASLVEKETGSAGERAVVAAVFRNRLRLGMPLQSDPTVVYERPGNPDRPITRADLLADNDYNTYQRRGLPPGPIANPGLAALQAALRPAAVDYLYFVARNDGTHEFSRTIEEHNRAVQRYQRPRRGAGAEPRKDA